MNSIKFFANFKNGKYFISGKNEKGIWYSLWVLPEDKDLFFDVAKFKGGLEIDKDVLTLLPDKDGNVGRVLVFKNKEEQNKYTIKKEDLSKKNKKGINADICTYILSLFVDLINVNNLDFGEFLKDELVKFACEDDKMLQPIKDENLPF